MHWPRLWAYFTGTVDQELLALDEISRRNLNTTTSVRHDDQLQEISASLKRVAETIREDCQKMNDGLVAMKAPRSWQLLARAVKPDREARGNGRKIAGLATTLSAGIKQNYMSIV